MNRRKIFSTLCGFGLTATASLSGESSYTDAQSFEPGHELCNKTFPAAYNAAARIDACNSWDFFATASFTYWHADQDGMDLGSPPFDSKNTDHEMIIQNFTYSPGFKLGIGMNFGHDGWIGFSEYTWFRQKTTRSAFLNPILKNSLFFEIPPEYGNYDSDAFESRWHLHIDLLDCVLARPFYLGRALTIHPFGGLRGGWIRQQCLLTKYAIKTNQPTFTANVSHSWAVGPRIGTKTAWLAGWGFRLEGDLAASLLYTNYKVNHQGTAIIKEHDESTLRPEVDFALGLGWGTYLDRQNYHLDILATYDFSIFWKQNMMRPEVNFYHWSDISVPGDLNLHGLTITTRFDF